MIEQEMRNYLREAYSLALNSPDPSTKVGALILLAVGGSGYPVCFGWNHIPAGITIDLTDRVLKYKVIEHAERAAIFQAARRGIALEGAILVCPWACCCDCARAITLSGISEVVSHGDAIDKTPSRWQQDIDLAAKIFASGNVKYTKFYGKIGDCENLFNGGIWHP
jgi:dCMP deaminase